MDCSASDTIVQAGTDVLDSICALRSAVETVDQRLESTQPDKVWKALLALADAHRRQQENQELIAKVLATRSGGVTSLLKVVVEKWEPAFGTDALEALVKSVGQTEADAACAVSAEVGRLAVRLEGVETGLADLKVGLSGVMKEIDDTRIGIAPVLAKHEETHDGHGQKVDGLNISSDELSNAFACLKFDLESQIDRYRGGRCHFLSPGVVFLNSPLRALRERHGDRSAPAVAIPIFTPAVA